jgi:hypothetical protein
MLLWIPFGDLATCTISFAGGGGGGISRDGMLRGIPFCDFATRRGLFEGDGDGDAETGGLMDAAPSECMCRRDLLDRAGCGRSGRGGWIAELALCGSATG